MNLMVMKPGAPVPFPILLAFPPRIDLELYGAGTVHASIPSPFRRVSCRKF